MKQLKYIYGILIVAMLAISITSCEDMLDIDLPSNEMTKESVFVDSATIESAVNALYAQNFYNNPFYYYLVPYYGAVIADESIHNVASLEVFNQNSYEESTAGIANIWTYAYQSVYLSNSLIVRLEGSTAISEKRKEQFLSEAKFFRAYCYFILLNFYGDVPLILDIDYKETMVQGRESTATIYDRIITDLKEAEAGISGSSNKLNKVTQPAITALLARVYLYTKQWDKAETKAGEVIANPSFGLEAVDNVFLRSSKETILRMEDFLPYIGRTYWGGVYCRNANYNWLRDELVNAFEAGDARKDKWIGKIGTRTYYQSTKYKRTTNTTDIALAEDHIFIRLAEMYLIRAEARAHQDNLLPAISDVNEIRRRASLTDLPNTLSKADVLSAIEQERRVELFSEEAHRWWDLKRTGRIDAVLGAIADKSWKSYKALWPIPETQRNYNPNLTPNPGYGAIN